MTNDGVSQIKQKVVALLRKASDSAATAAEAEGAMAAARKLMAKFSLTEDEVNAATEESYVDRALAPKRTRKGEVYIDPVMRYCSRTVAEFCGVFAYTRVADQHMMWSGLESDVDLALCMIDAFQQQMEHDWEIFKRHELGTNRLVVITDARRSFVHGFTRGVVMRLQDWMYRTPPEGELVDTTNALVIKKSELARSRLEKQGMAFGSSGHRGNSGNHNGAAGAGLNAAKAAAMGRGVGGGVKMIGAR